jgi:hypothetical protein
MQASTLRARHENERCRVCAERNEQGMTASVSFRRTGLGFHFTYKPPRSETRASEAEQETEV